MSFADDGILRLPCRTPSGWMFRKARRSSALMFEKESVGSTCSNVVLLRFLKSMVHVNADGCVGAIWKGVNQVVMVCVKMDNCKSPPSSRQDLLLFMKH